MSRIEIRELGDSAFCLEGFADPVSAASYLRSADFAGVVDIVPAFDQVAVYFDSPENADRDLFRNLNFDLRHADRTSKTHNIPISLDFGIDQESVEILLGISVAELLTESEMVCLAVGFCPGFPYLKCPSSRVERLPRKTTPSIRIEPGTVALADGMCGIYPIVRPGGWHQVARTPLTIVDPNEGYFPIAAGDKVVFKIIDRSEYEARLGERL